MALCHTGARGHKKPVPKHTCEEVAEHAVVDPHFEEVEPYLTEGSAQESFEKREKRKVRVTYYCPSCNSPRGSHKSASGARLREGYVAYNGAPLGSTIELDGKKYKVVDRCGIPNTVDIFKDTSSCHCSGVRYATVYIYKK